MYNRIFKISICKIDLPDIACRKLLQKFIGKLHGIGIGRLFNNIRTVPGNMIAISAQRILTLFTDAVYLQFFFLQLAPCDQLNDIGVIAARKSSVGGNDDHCLFCRTAGLQIAMLHAARLLQNTVHCFIHTVKVCLGLLGTLFGSLQLYGGNKLHGFGDLLGTLDTAFTSFYVSHRRHNRHLPF